MKESTISKTLRIVLYITFALGVALTITLPFMLDRYRLVFPDPHPPESNYGQFLLFFLMVLGILGLSIVWELIRMMHTIPSDPFVHRNVVSFRRLGVFAMLIAALFLFKCLLYATFLTMVCGFLFCICGLMAFTLCSLFKRAIAFKEENELTI